jgi:hypothetical protein
MPLVAGRDNDDAVDMASVGLAQGLGGQMSGKVIQLAQGLWVGRDGAAVMDMPSTA